MTFSEALKPDDLKLLKAVAKPIYSFDDVHKNPKFRCVDFILRKDCDICSAKDILADDWEVVE
jgi:hypothetical protein